MKNDHDVFLLIGLFLIIALSIFSDYIQTSEHYGFEHFWHTGNFTEQRLQIKCSRS